MLKNAIASTIQRYAHLRTLDVSLLMKIQKNVTFLIDAEISYANFSTTEVMIIETPKLLKQLKMLRKKKNVIINLLNMRKRIMMSLRQVRMTNLK